MHTKLFVRRVMKMFSHV